MDCEEKEINKNSFGHILFEHYKDCAVIVYLENLMNDLKEKILKAGTVSALNETIIEDIKYYNKVYNYLKREREKVIAIRDEQGLVKMEEHNAFMKYIEMFSMKEK